MLRRQEVHYITPPAGAREDRLGGGLISSEVKPHPEPRQERVNGVAGKLIVRAKLLNPGNHSLAVRQVEEVN
jgi:hypothetical protein